MRVSSQEANSIVTHPVWGEGRLVRVEGTDWIVFFSFFGRNMRLPAEARSQLQVTIGSRQSSPLGKVSQEPIKPKAKQGPSTSGKGVKTGLSPQGIDRLLAKIGPRALPPLPINGHAKVIQPDSQRPNASASKPGPERERVRELKRDGLPSLDARHKRRAIESLANGLPPANEFGRYLAVDFEVTDGMIKSFLTDVDTDGGGALVVKGGYGQGKTFGLRRLEEVAYESGYLVARTEVDASENRLNKPHHIYRDLIRHLRVPGFESRGAATLVEAACRMIRKKTKDALPHARFNWLIKELGCEPLAWLLSDPQVTIKEQLIGLLAGDPQVPVGLARQSHAVFGTPRYWPAFSAGTQGDFACYVLSGIGRLARLLDLKGFVVVMDEMEKWQELNWREQSQAGNLLGGLIWGATESGDRRRRYSYPGGLTHSARCGGYPFATVPRSHFGLAIAMTPRSEEDAPERMWGAYGLLLDVDLPRLTVAKLRDYCTRIAPIFGDAYGTRMPDRKELVAITAEAVQTWKTHGEMTNRSAVQSAVAAFQNWRERVFYSIEDA